MSESEKMKAQDVLWQYIKQDAPSDVVVAWDALLAGHRAEVEASEAERKKLADRLERAVENVDTIASSARDSALEEAKHALYAFGFRLSEKERQDVLLPAMDVLHCLTSNPGVGDAALEAAATLTDARLDTYPSALGNDIRALKSKPARQYVDAEKVREVLDKYVHRDAAREAVLRDLGVDLDAEGEKATPNTPKVITAARNAVGLPPLDTRQTCMCVNTCVGPDELRAGWKCALGRERP